MAAGEFLASQPGLFDVVAEPGAMVFADAGGDHQPVVRQCAGASRNLTFFPVDRINLGLKKAKAVATGDVGIGCSHRGLWQQVAQPAVG